MKKSTPLILIDPSEVVVFSRKDNQMCSKIIVKNVFNQSIAFKVKSNAPNFYQVSPSKGLLSKGENITLKARATSIKDDADHSLMIISKSITNIETDFQKMWNQKSEFTQKVKLKLKINEAELKKISERNAEMSQLNKKLNEVYLKKDELKGQLKDVIQELKDTRIKTLESQCDSRLEYGYLQGIFVFISGFLFAIICVNIF